MVNRKCRNSMRTIYFQNEQIKKDKIPDGYDIRFELFVAAYLTIRLRARVFYEQTVNEAQPS